MILFSGFWQGVLQLWEHKVRSLLSIACVALGVASFVIVTALIGGMFSGWQAAISQVGGIEKVTTVDAPLPPKQRHLAGASRGRTLADVRALERLATFADEVSPEIDLQPSRITRRGKVFVGRTQGVESAILAINDYALARGRFLDDLDQRDRHSVIVLGTAVVKKLFAPNEDPLGQIVDVNDRPFTVVGVLQHYEKKQFGFDVLARKNQIAFIPITTMETLFTPQRRLTWLNLRARDASLLAALVDQTKNVLTQTHQGLRDVATQTNEAGFANFESTRATWLFGGAAVAVVSLLIGGIGIMNLMLASIRERIREIGVRKAVGAWNRDIFTLFLTEALALSLLGGLFGILAAKGVIDLLGLAASQISVPTFSLGDALVGLAFSGATGVLAGLYPAFEASRLDPIEALRTD